MSGRSTEPALADALESGPFSLALRLAIQASGLSLERLQHHLREQGLSVSRTALSYWQSGRTQPERADSLRAVGVLERMLDLPGGSLVTLLGPPRPRGRWSGHHPSRPDQAWARPEGLWRALAQLEATPDCLTRLERLRHSALLRMDAHRQIRSLTTQVVVRAHREPVWRELMVHRSFMAGVPGPEIEQARGWRPGRIRNDPETGFEVHEMLLDRELPVGGTAVLEYTLAFPPGHIDRYASFRVDEGMRELTVEIAFDPAVLPAHCHAYFQPSVAHPKRAVAQLRIGCSAVAAHVMLDPEHGIHGVSWEWD
ncbi:hypothetical protein ACIBKY_46570 [Nonomuraea sp. NPDC050394]|uniref:hypothetical protein n=1 Tax=Nonomuraea sp. NPDC050394 TaxID=3364363 RepID=UPI003793DF84